MHAARRKQGRQFDQCHGGGSDRHTQVSNITMWSPRYSARTPTRFNSIIIARMLMNIANDNLDELRRAERLILEEAKRLQTRLDELKSNLARLTEVSNKRPGDPDSR